MTHPPSSYLSSLPDRSRSFLHEFYQPDQPGEIECSQSVATIDNSQQCTDATTVEVRLKPGSTARIDTLRRYVKQHLELDESIYLPSEITGWESNSILREHVEAIYACETSCVCQFTFVFYRLTYPIWPFSLDKDYYITGTSTTRYTRISL